LAALGRPPTKIGLPESLILQVFKCFSIFQIFVQLAIRPGITS
jgi:hypothetical protein